MCGFVMLQFLIFIVYIAGPKFRFRCNKRGFQSFSFRSIPMLGSRKTNKYCTERVLVALHMLCVCVCGRIVDGRESDWLQ